jgi:hypothetical protein
MVEAAPLVKAEVPLVLVAARSDLVVALSVTEVARLALAELRPV